MILTILKGGLGNQMFQYAFGVYVSKLFNTSLFLEIGIHLKGSTNRLYDLDIFNIQDNSHVGTIADLKNTWYTTYEIISEKYYSYDEQLILTLKTIQSDLRDDNFLIVLDGYWQSYKYFLSLDELIRKSFCLDLDLKDHFLKLFSQISSTNSVMVNVRRGDYLDKMDYHGVIDVSYLSDSMALMEKNINEPQFFIFSDDIYWCRMNIKAKKNVIFVNETYYDHKFQSYFKLMCNCKYFIISNSTFCWWAAWLGDFPKKIVIAPKKWFATETLNSNDLIPKEWISL